MLKIIRPIADTELVIDGCTVKEHYGKPSKTTTKIGSIKPKALYEFQIKKGSD